MSNLNISIIQGNLTRDPETRHTTSGTQICSFSVACNRSYTKDGNKMEEVTFIDVTAFGKTAEIVGQYFKKGSAIIVRGRLKTESWTDKQTNAKRSKLVLVAEEISFFGGKRESAEEREQAPRTATSTGEAEDEVPF